MFLIFRLATKHIQSERRTFIVKCVFPRPLDGSKTDFLLFQTPAREASSLFYFAGSDTGGADFFSDCASAFRNTDGLDVGMENPFVVFHNVHSNAAGFFRQTSACYGTTHSAAFAAYLTSVAHSNLRLARNYAMKTSGVHALAE
jgi:hypothetical protein